MIIYLKWNYTVSGFIVFKQHFIFRIQSASVPPQLLVSSHFFYRHFILACWLQFGRTRQMQPFYQYLTQLATNFFLSILFHFYSMHYIDPTLLNRSIQSMVHNLLLLVYIMRMFKTKTESRKIYVQAMNSGQVSPFSSIDNSTRIRSIIPEVKDR